MARLESICLAYAGGTVIQPPNLESTNFGRGARIHNFMNESVTLYPQRDDARPF